MPVEGPSRKRSLFLRHAFGAGRAENLSENGGFTAFGHDLIAPVVLSCRPAAALAGSKSSCVTTVFRDGIAAIVAEFAAGEVSCWRNRLGFKRIHFARRKRLSGLPERARTGKRPRQAQAERLADIPDPDELRAEMADFILRHKEFPGSELQKQMAERLYLEDIKDGVFRPVPAARNGQRVSVNPKTMRPYYVVHWAAFDGTANLPLIYMATVEDSSEAHGQRNWSTRTASSTRRSIFRCRSMGLLNPELANRFDDFTEKNSAYSLSPATIAVNLDKDFETLHPKQLRRFVLGPFYSAGITEHNSTVSAGAEQGAQPENAWLLTWTMQEIFSKAEKPGRKGLWSSEPAREEFFISTPTISKRRGKGVSAYEKHALVPHEAYQALYAAGEAKRFLDGYKVHILSKGNQVISG